MNVYDFDKTIFYPDSMVLFAKFCIKRHPKLLFTYGPKNIKAALGYAFGKYDFGKLDSTLNSIVRYLDNPDEDVKAFWKKNDFRFSEWYMKQRKSDDLIISASPDYLLEPICKELGVNLICTKVDKETGVMIGNIRLAKGKAQWIIEHDMPVIENFYSDSLMDSPMALLAERAFLVVDKARVPIPWPHFNEDIKKIVKKKINIYNAKRHK